MTSPPARLGPVPARSSLGTFRSRAEALGYGRGWLLRNLPVVMQEDELLARVVTVFEEIATTTRHAVVSVDRAADLSTTTPGMVDYLGSWIGAPHGGHAADVAHHRRIVAAAGATLGGRGTAGALRALLAAVTGGPVEVVDPGGVRREARAERRPVVVRVTTCGTLRPAELVALVRDEVPAHVGCEIWMGEEQLWPSTTLDRTPLTTPTA